MSEIKGISLDGSIDLNWDLVDSEVQRLGFKDRSKFIQYCIESVIFKKRFERRYLIEIIILCLVAMSFLMLLFIFMGG
jgi:hypothetical protein